MFIPRARHQRVAIMALLFLAVAYGAKKKNADDTTQTLDLPKDPPVVAMGPGGTTFNAADINPTLYDVIGRVFSVGIRFKM